MTSRPETAERPPFERLVTLDQIDNGAAREIAAGPEECAAIARWLGLEGLGEMRAAFTFSRAGRDLDVVMRLVARADRLCVASLEPMVEAIDETVRMRFERDFDPAAEDDDDDLVREPWPGETLDLGALAADYLALSLAPHPRKSDAPSLGDAFGSAALSSPFAALEALVDAKSKPAS